MKRKKERAFLGAVKCTPPSSVEKVSTKIYEEKTDGLKMPSTYFLLGMDDRIDCDVVNAYDVCIMDAMISLWAAGNQEVSPQDVCRVLNCAASDAKIRKEQVKLVIESLLRLFSTHVQYDWKKEPELKDRVEDACGSLNCWETKLVYIGGVDVTKNLKNGYFAYRFETDLGDGQPSFGLLKYSAVANRLLAVDAKLLDIKKVVRGRVIDKELFRKKDMDSRANMQVIREYLLSEIEWEKRFFAHLNDYFPNSGSFNFVIQFPVFDDIAIDETIKHVITILKYWRAVGYIAHFGSEHLSDHGDCAWEDAVWDADVGIEIECEQETTDEKSKRAERESAVQKIWEMYREHAI